MSDWIKVRKDLANDPCILTISQALNVSTARILGSVIWLLFLANDFTRDGKIKGLTPGGLDLYVELKGFAEELVKCDCIFFSDQGAELLRFYEPHNTKVQT
jgi:hypothetical protein